jgi:hypothetical protein
MSHFYATHAGQQFCGEMSGRAVATGCVDDVARLDLGEWVVICGMAMGYADGESVVNTFQPERITLEDYATFLD